MPQIIIIIIRFYYCKIIHEVMCGYSWEKWYSVRFSLVSCITFNSSCFVSASDLKIQLQIITSQLDECMWYDQIPVKIKMAAKKNSFLDSFLQRDS